MWWVERFESDDEYVDIKNIVNEAGQEVTMGAILPSKSKTIIKDDYGTYKREIVSIEGVYDDNCHVIKNNKAIYPAEYYNIIPGDQYCGIKVVVKLKNEYITEGFEEEYIIQISGKQNCCEIWGSFLSEDDLSRYIGTELLDIYFTDTTLNNEYISKIATYKDSFDCHNIQFVNFKTSKGTFQFTVYNCHNGYYGHDVTVMRNEYETLYKTRI